MLKHLATLLLVSAALVPAPAFAQEADPCDGMVTWTGIVPDCLTTGDSYRILFITSTPGGAGNPDITEYNNFLQGQADAVPEFAGITFRVLGSTFDVSARENTMTTGAGANIRTFYYRGRKVADDYNDLYDATWDTDEGRDQQGATVAGDVQIFTGSRNDGTRNFHLGADESGTGITSVSVAINTATDTQGLGSGSNTAPPGDFHPFFALSDVLMATLADTAGAPAFGNEANIDDQIYIASVNITPLTLPAATGGDGPLSYTITPQLPRDLTLTGRILSGSGGGTNERIRYTYRVSDSDINTDNSDTDSLTFDIDTLNQAGQQRPVFSNTENSIAPLSYLEDVAINPILLPQAFGGSVNFQMLTYSIEPALPPGLTLTERTLAGTPTMAQPATPYTYIVHDSDVNMNDFDSARLDFTIEVVAPTATLAGPLTEAGLFAETAPTVTVTLTGSLYAAAAMLGPNDFIVSNTIAGDVTVTDVTRTGSQVATLTLAYDDEDITGDGTLSVTVRASGHTGVDDLDAGSIDITASAGVNICGRTPVVQDVILAESSASECTSVDDLATLFDSPGSPLDLENRGITMLQPGDFAGLTGIIVLDLSGNQLETLPDNIFAGLTRLQTLELESNRLATLPVDVFDDLSALQGMLLNNNRLVSLDSEIFDGLDDSLFGVRLHNNLLESLPADIFEGVPNIGTELTLDNNRLTELPATIFNGINSFNLATVTFFNNPWTPGTGLPVGVFDRLSINGFNATNESMRSGFGVDDAVRAAHFACSHPDVERIVAADPSAREGVTTESHCPLITSAQFNTFLRTDTALRDLAISAGILAPAFALTTTTYTVAVPNSVATVTVTPTAARIGAQAATITVNGVNVDSGATSGEITLAEGMTTDITIEVTAPDGMTTGAYTIMVTRPAAAADTAVLTGTLTEAALFAATPPTVTVTLTGTDFVAGNGLMADDFVVRDTIDGSISISGAARSSTTEAVLTLAYVGSDISAEGRFFVTLLASGHIGTDELAAGSLAVTVSAGANICGRMPPVRAEIVRRSTGGDCTDVPDLATIPTLDLSSQGLTALRRSDLDGLDALAMLRLNGNPFTAGGLPAGIFDGVLNTLGDIDTDFIVDNAVRQAHFVCSRADAGAVVAATTGVSDCLRITEAHLAAFPAVDASLRALSLSVGDLMPAFEPTITAYDAGVDANVASVTVTPVANQNGAAISVNGATVPSGSASAAVPLVANTPAAITIEVTAADTMTTMRYVVMVTRGGASAALAATVPLTEARLFSNTAGDRVVQVTLARADFVDMTALTGADFTVSETLDGTVSVAATVQRTSANEAVLTLEYTGSDITTDGVISVTVLDSAHTGTGDLRTNTLPVTASAGANVCRRTTQVRNAIVASRSAVECTSVPNVAALTNLDLSGANIPALRSGDFAGLVGLTTLNLRNTRIATLPVDIFAGLSALEELELRGTSLTTLPAGIFAGLDALVTLSLGNNGQLAVLEVGVFAGLRLLEELFLDDDNLDSLEAGVFAGLESLEDLIVRGNPFTPDTGLPAGIFDDVVDTLVAVSTTGLRGLVVDATGRAAHFVCSLLQAPLIEAANTGTDCLRITEAQLAAFVMVDTSLSGLEIADGELDPAFDVAVTNYAVAVHNRVATITVTPTASQPGATITVNGANVNSGAASGGIDLAVGMTTDIAIEVTAVDGATTQTYTIRVARAERVTATLAAPTSLTDTNLDGAMVTVTLVNTEYVESSALDMNDFTLLPGSVGGTVTISGVTRTGNTVATLTLAHTGAVTTDGTLSVTVLATGHMGDEDLMTGTVPVIFNTAPAFGDEASIAAQRYVVGVDVGAVTLPAATSGNGALRYAISPNLPAGLTHTAAARTITGAPAGAAQVATTYTYTASDSDMNVADTDTDVLTFTIAVRINTAPTAMAVIPVNAQSGRIDVYTGTVATLDGSGSRDQDADDSIATYTWTQTGDTATTHPVTLDTTTPAMPTFTAPAVTAATDLEFSLIVTDTAGVDSAPVTVDMLVNLRPRVVISTEPASVNEGSGTIRILFTLDPNGGPSPNTLNSSASIRETLGLEGATSEADFGLPSADFIAGGPADYQVPGFFTTIGPSDSPGRIISNLPLVIIDDADAETTEGCAAGTTPVPATADNCITIWHTAGGSATNLGDIGAFGRDLFLPTEPLVLAIADNDPTLNPATIDALTYIVGAGISSVTLPIATGGNPPLAYTISSLPDGLTLTDNILSGIPETVQELTTHTYTVTDSGSNTDTIDFTITINANTITGTVTGVVTEDDNSATTATGTLALASGDFVAQDGATDRAGGLGAYGNFVLNATSGVWTYTLNNDPATTQGAVTHALAAGAMVTDVFTVVSAIDSGVTREVTITVTGANDAPVAEAAGAPQTVTVGTPVTLDGSGSSDPDAGDAIDTYTWTHTGGAPSVTLTGPATAMPTFTAPDVSSATTLIFTLVVNDGTDDSPADTVTITVNPDNVPGFSPATIPVQRYSVGLDVGAVTLPAATGGDGALTYTLTPPLPTGLTYTAAARTITGAPAAGTVQVATAYTYTVSDTDTNAAPTDTDVLTFTIAIRINTAPTAMAVLPVNAQSGRMDVYTGTVATLDGSGSRDQDADDSIATYAWTQTGPTATSHPVALDTTTPAMPTFMTPAVTAATDLEFSLIVTDTAGADSAPVTVAITVNLRPRVVISVAPASVNEGSGAITIRFTLDPNGGPSPGTMNSAASIRETLDFEGATSAADFDFSGGEFEAGGPADYQVPGVSTTIDPNDAPGQIISELPLMITDDTDAETIEGCAAGTAIPSTADNCITIFHTAGGASTTLGAIGGFGADLFLPTEPLVVAITDNDPTLNPTTIDAQTYTVGVGITPVTLPTATGGNGALTYTLAPLPDGLTLTDNVLSGIPETVQELTTHTYTVTDNDSNTDTIDFTITINANTITGTVTGVVTEDDNSANTATGTLALGSGDFVAQNGATDRAGGLGAYGNFVLNATSGVWTYTLNNDPATTQGAATHALAAGAMVTDVFTAVSAIDSGVTREVTITVTGANDAPVAEAGAPQTVTVGAPVTLDGSGSSDPDTGDAIDTYTWTHTGGAPSVTLTGPATAMPAFTAPGVSSATTLMFTLVVNDGTDDSPADTVTITVNPDAVPDFSTATIPAQRYTVGLDVGAVTLPAATGGDGALAYTLTPSLPTGLTYTAAARTITGVPAAGTPQVATPYTYTASDSDTNTADTDTDVLTFTIAIQDNTVPAFAGAGIPVQGYTVGLDIGAVTLPAATGGNGALRYTISPNLPAGLTLTGNILSGIPGMEQSATTYTYRASDSDSDTADTDTASLTFTITIVINTNIIGTTTGAVTEDMTTATGRLTIGAETDAFVPQAGATNRANGLGLYGTFRLDVDGVWSYTLDNVPGTTQGDATHALAAGDMVTDIFTAVSVDDSGVTRDVTITVTGANDAPVANAGPDQSAIFSGATVTLDGRGSSDPDTGDAIDTYAWTQTGGAPTVTLNDDSAAMPTFTAPAVTTATALRFSLVVNDGTANAVVADTVIITVNSAPTATLTAPTALTEATLNGATVTVTLLRTQYETTLSAAGFMLSTVSGVTVASVARNSANTAATLTLAYDGTDIAAAGALSVTILASAHTGRDALVTGSVNIATSDSATLAAMPALTGNALDGATVTVTLMNAQYAASLSAADFTLTTVDGVTVNDAARTTNTVATLTLAHDGARLAADGELRVTLAASAHSGGNSLVTNAVPIAATTDATAQLNAQILPRVVATVLDGGNRLIVERLRRGYPANGGTASSTASLRQQVGQWLSSNASQAELFRRLQGLDNFELRDVVDGLAFSTGGDQAGSTTSLYGSGGYTRLSGDQDAPDWDGGLMGGYLGVDWWVGTDVLIGMSVSYFQGEFEYADLPASDGEYDIDVSGIHPYIGWSLSDDLDLWASLGYGIGKIELEDSAGRRSSDLEYGALNVGAIGRLYASEGHELRLRADALTWQIDLAQDRDGFEDLDNHRLRLLLDASATDNVASGILRSGLELGIRHDGGDHHDGQGVEVGGSVEWRDVARGLTLSGRGRLLAGAEYDEWGLSGALEVSPGQGSRGLSLSLSPGYGQNGSGLEQLWASGASSVSSGSRTARTARMRLDSEVGYGMWLPDAMMQPYLGLSLLEGGGRTQRMGARFEFGRGVGLELEGSRLERRSADAEHRINVQWQWSW